MSIRVLLVDQHEIMRAGTKLAFSDCEDLTLVGEAGSIEAGRRIASHATADVAIIDPDCDPEGLQAIGRLHQEMPELKILVFTSNDSQDYATRIMRTGASGYLIKLAGLDEIPIAIRLVHMGRIFISHTRHEAPKPKLVPPTPPGDEAPQWDSNDATAAGPPHPDLSAREQEVLSLLADGMTNKQAAEQLFLSVKTVETYRSRIMKKYQLRDRSELVRFARRLAGNRLTSA